MITVLRFIAGIVLYFAAADLLIDFLDIARGSNTWLFMNIFSGCIGIVATFFVSPYAVGLICFYLVYDIGSTIWNEEGFFNILALCGDSMLQFWLAGLLMKLYEDSTGKEYGEEEFK